MTTQQIPGPKGGIFGLKNVFDFQQNPIEFLMKTVHDFPNDIIFWKFGPMYDVYLLTHPDYIRELLVKQWGNVVKWERMATVSNKVAGQSLVILEGDIWKKARKLTAPAFHTQRIKHYIDLMVEHTAKLIEKWEDGSVIEIERNMVEVTMGIIGEILFDIKDIEEDAHELNEALLVLLEMFMLETTAVMPIPDWVPTPRNLRENQAMKIADEYIMKIIRQRRASGEDKGDVLSALLQAVDEDNGGTFTDREVRDQLLGLFIAGHETTAVLMTWALYILAKHPDVQEKLYAEVQSVMNDGTPSLEDLDTMNFTDEVLQETMRMYPPAWAFFVRQVETPFELGGHPFKKGDLFFVSPWVVQHDPRWWENPQIFDPSRFEGDWKATRPTYAYMPFGGGPRVCVGSHMAEMEAEVILSTLVKNFVFELSEPDQIVEPEPRFTIHPKGGMHLRVCKRQ